VIDIENIVFENVAKAVQAVYPKAFVTSEKTDAPPSFPCVCVTEEDNSTHRGSLDTSLIENNANIMYSLSVFTNEKNGKKSTAKRIANIADMAMQNMKFTRIMLSPIPNADTSIFRIEGRYTAVVSAGKTENDNTVYQMYRQ
jgi:hypothetical protein